MASQTLSYVCFGASFVTLAFAFILATSTNPHLFNGKYGPKAGKRLNRTTLLVWMFVALVIYNLGSFFINNPYTFLRFAVSYKARGLSCIPFYALRFFSSALGVMFRSLRMMLAGIDIPRHQANVPEIVNLYSHIVFVLAPVTTICSVIDKLTEFFSVRAMLSRSKKLDTFVLTPLNERTVILAKSIIKHYEGGEDGSATRSTGKNRGGRKTAVNVVFTDARANGDSSLEDRAHIMRATVLKQSMESVLRELGDKGDVSVVIDSDNEAWNVTKARSIARSGEDAPSKTAQVYFVSNPYGTRTNDAEKKENVPGLHRIDWTRNLVETTLNDYPTFLPSLPPALPWSRSETYLAWQNSMLERPERHILVVGAGHVGIEFLRRAMSCSRIYGMDYTFDVFDKTYGDLSGGTSTARQRVRAIAPELLVDDVLNRDHNTRLRVHFHNYDVRSDDYTWFLKDNCKTISYVFIALGDDTLTADIAQRTRTTLNRELVNITARSKVRLEDQDRPVIIAVIDDDQLSEVIANRWAYSTSKIVTVGSSSQMYTYDMMFRDHDPDGEYYTMSTRASLAHAKYRLFAYERWLKTGQRGRAHASDLAIVWGEKFDEQLAAASDTRTAAEDYNSYLDSKKAECPEGEIPEYEWLLRMEHARWSTYMRAEGYCHVPPSYVEVYYQTAKETNYVYADDDSLKNGDSGHRYDEALIHACLVPFDELGDVRNVVNTLSGSGGQRDYFWKNDEEQLHIPLPE